MNKGEVDLYQLFIIWYSHSSMQVLKDTSFAFSHFPELQGGCIAAVRSVLYQYFIEVIQLIAFFDPQGKIVILTKPGIPVPSGYFRCPVAEHSGRIHQRITEQTFCAGMRPANRRLVVVP